MKVKIRNERDLKSICNYFDSLLYKEYGIKFNSFEAIESKDGVWDYLIDKNDIIEEINNKTTKTFYDIIFCFSSINYFYGINLYDSLYNELFVIKNYFDYIIKQNLIYDKNTIKRHKNKKLKDKNKKYKIKVNIFDKIGMETEINHERLNFYQYAGDYYKNDFEHMEIYEYIKEIKIENEVILEIVSKPISRSSIELLEFFDVLNEEIYSNDWSLWAGMDDEFAESNHTHLSFNKEKYFNMIKENPNIMLLFVPAYCRNGKFFRDAVYYSDYSIIKELDNIPFDSKTYYLTINTEFNTLEVRGNENPFPYWIFLLESLLFNYNKINVNEYIEKIIKLLKLEYTRLYRDVNIGEVFYNMLDFYILLCELLESKECKVLLKVFKRLKNEKVKNYNYFIFNEFYKLYV